MVTRNRSSHIEKKAKSSYKSLAPAVEQASKVLFCLGKNLEPKMALTDICRHVGIYKSKGYSILKTLTHFGLVEKNPSSLLSQIEPHFPGAVG
jgi:DNA-binding IclR family transcriptional regulator